MNTAAIQSEAQVQSGRLGRLVVARLKPNEDIIDSAEALCKEHGIDLAVVRGGLGSLIDGQLSYLGREGLIQIHVPGPGVEILSVSPWVMSPSLAPENERRTKRPSGLMRS